MSPERNCAPLDWPELFDETAVELDDLKPPFRAPSTPHTTPPRSNVGGVAIGGHSLSSTNHHDP